MKGILKFDLDDIDDRMAHMRSVKSLDLALCLWNIRETIHRFDKYLDENISATEILDRLMTECNEIYEKHDINLDELIR